MVEYTGLKVADLKDLLKQRGLGVSGTKAELVARLEEDDSKGSAAEAPEEIQPVEKAEEVEKTKVPEVTEVVVPQVQEESKPAEGAVEENDGARTASAVAELERRIKRNERFGAEDANKELKDQIERIKKFGLEPKQAKKLLAPKVLGNRVGKSLPKVQEIPAPLVDEATLKRRKERFGLV